LLLITGLQTGVSKPCHQYCKSKEILV
jgi:hypothetical protein